MPEWIEKRFRILAAIPILGMTALQLASIVRESATFDEGVHMAAGHRYWRTGTFTLNTEHPPLQKLISALPLLALGVPMPADESLLVDQSKYANAFLYHGPFGADRLLLLARLPTLLLSLLLLVTVAWTARQFFGASAALFAVWLCALDPNLIAHGRYVTTDMISALLYVLTSVLWVRYLLAPSGRRAAAAAAALGLALSAKFSMILLLPLLPSLVLLHWMLRRVAWKTAAHALAVSVLVIVVAAGVVLAAYGPESWLTFRGQPIGVGPETVAGVPLPAHTYLTGLFALLEHNKDGHPAYLLGRVSESGWWYYFPFVFVVKSPSALLLLMLLAAAIALWSVPRFLHDPPGGFLWLALLLPPLAYFGVALASHINLGVRHLLPVYPFLYILGAAALLRALPPRAFGTLAVSLGLLQAAETATAFPEYLGFFNTVAGGAAAGPAYLLDSNVDWGQDLKKLKEYLVRENPGALCLYYFGSAEPAYYGIRSEYLPRTWDRDERERMDCLGAISVTLLHDLYLRPGSFAWLRQRKPVAVVGSSIFLYDLRKPKSP